MRIIAGKYKGKRLTPIPTLWQKGTTNYIRPTGNRIREAIFNILSNCTFKGCLEHARVADICAGSGALGLEAISRGARHTTFIDNNKQAQKTILKNIALCQAHNQTRLLPLDVKRLTYPPHDLERMTLVFFDPPYHDHDSAIDSVLVDLCQYNWLDNNALVVYEHNRRAHSYDGYAHLTHKDRRIYGHTVIDFLIKTNTYGYK